MSMKIGVLALQGDFAEHKQMLTALGVESLEVRTIEDLAQADRLILPGGESTVMVKMLEETGLFGAIASRFIEGSLPIFATCAGAILVAKEVVGDSLTTLDLIDISIERNAYGRQLQSFRTELEIQGVSKKVPVSFIRAPKITRVGEGLTVLATYEECPVLVQGKNILVATFHSEVVGETAVHELFVV
jgi:5'-phosphate synthase pdxT subunit